MGRRRLRALLAGGVAVAAALAGGVAWAYWSAGGAGTATASTDSLPAGGTPTATVTGGSTVTVSFDRAFSTAGHDVTSYAVRRYAAPTGGAPSAGFTCSWPTAGTLSCTETGVPAGVWYYTDTPLAGSSWVGTESARSNPASTDSTPPTVAVTSITPPPNGNGYHASSPVTVTLTASDNPGGAGVASISYWVDAGAHATVTASTAAVSVADDGTHAVSYFATDNAGNTSATATQTVRIDTVAPGTATMGSYPNPVNLANGAGVAVSGSAEPAATVTLTIGDAGSAHTVTATTTADGSGAWSVTGIDLTALTDGTISYTVTATDAAGNTATASRTATKDVVLPTVTALAVGPTGNASTGRIRASGSYYVYANATDTTPGTVAAVTANVSALTGGATAVVLTSTGGPFTAGGVSYAYRSAALTAGSGLPAGSKTFTAAATDAAGNASTAATGSVGVDTTAPTPASVTLANRTGGLAGKPENGDTLTFAFSEEMDPATLYTGWAWGSTPDVTNAVVTFSDNPGGNGTNQPDSLAVTGPSGISLGTVTNLEGHLVTAKQGSYTFGATLHYAVTGGQSVVTVTLGSVISGATGIGTAGSGTFTWAAASTSTDLAANPVSGTVNRTAVPF